MSGRVCSWRLPSAGPCTWEKLPAQGLWPLCGIFQRRPWNFVNYEPMLQDKLFLNCHRRPWQSCPWELSPVTLLTLQNRELASQEAVPTPFPVLALSDLVQSTDVWKYLFPFLLPSGSNIPNMPILVNLVGPIHHWPDVIITNAEQTPASSCFDISLLQSTKYGQVALTSGVTVLRL